MSGYRISEVAERTGFSPATLRYYEDIGVVPAPARSEAGYRHYDERALRRLRFVARAKQLGLSLKEVGDLAGVWDGGECGPVQQRMADFVADRIAETRARAAELTALADQLQAVATRLGEEPQTGPCDDTCACNAETPVPVQMDLGANSPPDEVPIACTLGPDALAKRLCDWNAVLSRVVGREPLDDGVRLRFEAEEGLAAGLAGLAQAEQACCAFFDFALRIGADAITLEVRAPVGARAVVEGLFGAAP